MYIVLLAAMATDGTAGSKLLTPWPIPAANWSRHANRAGVVHRLETCSLRLQHAGTGRTCLLVEVLRACGTDHHRSGKSAGGGDGRGRGGGVEALAPRTNHHKHTGPTNSIQPNPILILTTFQRRAWSHPSRPTNGGPCWRTITRPLTLVLSSSYAK